MIKRTKKTQKIGFSWKQYKKLTPS
jgi:hypothetical protein